MIISVDGCTFTVTAGIAGEYVTEPQVKEGEEPVGFIGTGVTGTVDSWTLVPGEIKLTGTVETQGGNPPIITEFSLGIVQTVVAFQRNALYSNGYTLSEQFQYGQPLRDGEPAELPFSYDESTPIEDVGSFSTAAEDPPMWTIPKQINGGDLVSTNGFNTLSSWLILARQPADPQSRVVVLLGRILWTVGFSAQVVGGKLQFTGNPQNMAPPVNLNIPMTAGGDYPVGDGLTWPDLREDVSGNDYIYGQWSVHGVTSPADRWSYDDEGGAVAFIEQPDPAVAVSWLTGQPSP